MRLKKSNSGRQWRLLLAGAIGLLVITALTFLKEEERSARLNEDNTDLKKETRIQPVLSYESILDSNYKGIYEDSIVSIYIVKQFDMPHLMYFYPDSLTERQQNDRFFVHVYLNDSTKITGEQQTKFLNFDFSPVRPFEEIEVKGRTYTVFKRKLVHDNYRGKVLDLKDIKQINTGRFDQKLGRSFQKGNLKIPPGPTLEIRNNLHSDFIRISKKNFEKLREYRDEAVKNGVISPDQKQLMPARITDPSSEEEIKVDIRLKGDWTDHVEDVKKWSLRVAMDQEKTINGMRKFSFQHPKVRNYAWEWLFQKAIKKEGLIGIRYDFVDLNLRVGSKEEYEEIPLGIMAREEAFDKILLENNRRREGIILSFDESYYWKDIEQNIDLGLEEVKTENKLFRIDSSPIRLYNENRILQDPNLKQQFETAKDLLDGFRQSKLQVSEAFDIDKLRIVLKCI